MADLKKVYATPTEQQALENLDEFAKRWDSYGLSTDDSLMKLLYLVTMDITKKWTSHRHD